MNMNRKRLSKIRYAINNKAIRFLPKLLSVAVPNFVNNFVSTYKSMPKNGNTVHTFKKYDE